jgi:hypothetical protein
MVIKYFASRGYKDLILSHHMHREARQINICTEGSLKIINLCVRGSQYGCPWSQCWLLV